MKVDQFPLGEPINRAPKPPGLLPIAGRPNWFKDKHGVEHYRELAKPVE